MYPNPAGGPGYPPYPPAGGNQNNGGAYPSVFGSGSVVTGQPVQPAYGQPAPAYGQPAPAYGQPAPAYGQPAPAYGQAPPTNGGYMMGGPAPGYGAPPPNQYGAPAYGNGYGAPPPQPMMGAPPGGGRKKAVLIGCNYAGTNAQLNGCINDARCLQYMLTQRFGFQPNEILMLTDDQRNPDFIPTRANMTKAMRWLVEGAQPGDSLFFSFSGHGGQQRAHGGDERDGMNETFCPCDFRRAGEISDDEVNAIMVRPLPRGVRLHAITDCCHSGSSFDLPFTARVKLRKPQWVAQERILKGCAGFVVQISACQDSELAADTSALSRGTHTGAATFTFIDAVEKLGPRASYAAVLAHMDRMIEQRVGGGGGGGNVGGGVAGAIGGGLLGGLLFGEAGMLMGALAGGAGGAMGGGFGGQNPMLSSNDRFDLNQPMCIL